MRGRPAAGALSVVFFLMLAGCTTSEGTSTTATPPPTTAEPTIETGVIVGRVVDDEQRPIPGATVAVLETNGQTQTTTDGSFSFPPVGPGKYGIVVESLGFASQAKKVDVRAGETTNVTFVLEAIVVGLEPYHLTVPKTAYVKFGNVFVDDATHLVNQSATNSLVCDPCRFPIHYAKGNLKDVFVETIWTSSVPLINTDIWLYYKVDWTTGTYIDGGGSNVLATYFSNREQAHITGGNLATLNSKEKVLVGVTAGTTVNYEMKPTVYTTFSWYGELQDDFSAMPPP